VYDMHGGIVKQIENGQQITNKVVQVLEATRKAGAQVFFTRHMSLPRELMGGISVPYGDGMATGDIARRGQAVVLAELSGIPSDSRNEPTTERSHFRQHQHVGVRR